MLIETLQDVDAINGGDGVDTINVTLLGAGKIAPSFTSIENVNVRFTTAGAGDLDLSSSTGVTNVGVANSTQDGKVSGVAGAALSVANQTKVATFEGSTATALNITAANVSDGAGGVVKIVADSKAADAATSLTLNVTDAMVDLDSTNNDAYTTVTINATGKNTVNLTDVAAVATTLSVAGAGSVAISGAMTAVKTLTAGDGGVTLDATGGVLETATTGAGKDTITVVGANVKTISTGAGNDTVNAVSSALAATAVVDLGAGDDTLTIADAAFAKNVTLSGGEGTDTIGMAKALYATVSGYTTAELSKVTGFEVLSISDALDGDTIDVSKISGVTSFKAAAGVATTKTADATNLGANATVELAGAAANNGELVVSLKADTGADTLTLILNKNYADDNNTVSAVKETPSSTVVAAEVETINVTSTAKQTATFTPVEGYKADTVTNTLVLDGSNKLVTLNISGDQKLVFATTAAMDKLTTINAAANTAGVEIDASLSTKALSITGTAKADVIAGGEKGDTITLGGGNDIVDYSVPGSVSKIGTGAFDVISDFNANTKADSATTPTQAGTPADWTGDVLRFDSGTGAAGVKLDIFTNAADATTFLANNASVTNGITAAFDSTNNNLYVDNTGDGVADFFIKLTGVTTLTEAAFVVV